MGLIDDQSVLCTALGTGRELLFSFVWGRKQGSSFLPYSWRHLLDRGKLAFGDGEEWIFDIWDESDTA